MHFPLHIFARARTYARPHASIWMLKAGHMGAAQVTVQNLDVVKVDVENNLLVVKGAIPGPKGSIVTVKNTVKNG